MSTSAAGQCPGHPRRFTFNISNMTAAAVRVTGINSVSYGIQETWTDIVNHLHESQIEENYIIPPLSSAAWTLFCATGVVSKYPGYDKGRFRLQVQGDYPDGPEFGPLCTIIFYAPLDSSSNLTPWVKFNNPTYPYVVVGDKECGGLIDTVVARVLLKIRDPIRYPEQDRLLVEATLPNPSYQNPDGEA